MNEIRRIHEESIEAKICVFSSFTGALDEVEHSLDTVTYDIMMETCRTSKIDDGDKVTELSTGREGVVHWPPIELLHLGLFLRGNVRGRKSSDGSA